MKMLIFLILTLSAVQGAENEPELPSCSEFDKFFFTENCQYYTLSQWKKNPVNNWWYYGISLSQSRGQSTKNPSGIRMIYVKDQELKKRVLFGETIMEQMRSDNVPKIYRAFDIGDWRVQEFDTGSLFHISFFDWTKNKIDDFIQRNNLKIFSIFLVTVKHVNSRKYALTNINYDTMYYGNMKDNYFISIIDFDQVVELGKAIDDRGDFRSWHPARLQGKETVWTEEADTYACTILLYNLIHKGAFPFSGSSKEEYQKSVENGEFVFDFSVYPELAILMAVMLRLDSKERLPISEFASALSILAENKQIDSQNKPIKLSSKGPIPEALLSQVRPGLKGIVENWVSRIKSDAPTNKVETYFDNLMNNKYIITIAGLAGLLIFGFAVWLCVRKTENEGPDDKTAPIDTTNTNDHQMKVESA